MHVTNYRLKTILCLFFVVSLVLGQEKTRFKQKVDYTIEAKLNDKEHILTGAIEIQYSNNSPDILDRIGMHLWPNAFSNKKTAFAKQKLLHRSTKFYDSKFEESGNIKIENLKVDGIDSKLEFVKDNPDMAWLLLSKVLKPGEKITIKANYSLKIPESFSRLGHTGQAYQITQWYMKPAVYDHKGWHLMPYLDQGEFYSEFGDFDVSISLPENYYVAATGELQDESEKKFIEARVIASKDILMNKSISEKAEPIESSDQYKTIQYKAENIHDFAWFADKSFLISKSEATLSSGKKIPTWAYYNDKKYWSKGAEFVSRAIEFYSEAVGEYPWSHATAVHSALSAGGGMEYPMITVINDVNSEKSLDIVICHEVGHNWFYGILASNEREHPWLDEGINSYYEGRYTRKYYNEGFLLQQNLRGIFSRFNISSETELFYQVLSHLNLVQTPGLSSEEFTALNYGYDVYKRVPDLFRYLESYLSTEELDRIMKSFFEKWKFRHPYPEDLILHFKEKNSKDLNWLFQDILYGNKKIDYAISKTGKKNNKTILRIKNKTKVPAPFQISQYKADSLIKTIWYDGFNGTRTIELEKEDIDRFKIDGQGNYFDYNSFDNTIRTKGILKKAEPIKIGLSSYYNNPDQTNILIYPSYLWNYINGSMLGIHIGRYKVPSPDWNIQLSPKYAFKSKSLTGTAELSYRRLFNSKYINSFKLGIFAKRFGLNNGFNINGTNHYLQLNPFGRLEFNIDQRRAITSYLKYDIFFIGDDVEVFNSIDSSYSKKMVRNKVDKLTIYYSDPSILGPLSYKLETYWERYKSIENARYMRVDLEILKSFRWKKRRYFDTRFFVSFFPFNTERNRNSIGSRQDQRFIRGSVGASYQAYLDYTNESNFLDRSSTSNLWTNQIDIRQGGLKIAPGVAQRTNLGNSNRFLASINLSSDIPIRSIGKLIRPYFDIAYVDINKNLVEGGNILYSGGIQLKLIPEVFSIYFPVINSANIKNIYESDSNQSYWKKITFSLKFQLGEYKDLINLVQ